MIDKRQPAEVFHPGEYLQDELTERKWTPLEFSQRTGIPIEKINSILEEKSPVLGWMAERFSLVLGTSAVFWSNLNLIFYKQQRRAKKK